MPGPLASRSSTVPSAELPLAPGQVHVDGHERQDLDAGWRVAACAPDACAAPAETDGLDWVPASVPGTAAGALRTAGIWDFGDGRELDAEDWWFRTEFEAAPAADGELVLLRLDGVATVHEVFLNGERIGGGVTGRRGVGLPRRARPRRRGLVVPHRVRGGAGG